MTREEIAEHVGCYFGLQQAGNMRPPIVDPTGDGARMLNALREMIDARMREIERKLPAGAVERWPRQ